MRSAGNCPGSAPPVTATAAPDVAERIREAGIHGILNFSPITLKPHPAENGEKTDVIHNINIALELEQIFYELKFPAIR